jgi:small subunit ribosomal protein S4
MARRLGSKHKLCRRVGERLCNTDKCPVIRRSYPPGVHGTSKARRKLTSFGVQLLEKQKAKFIYGLLERQFKNYVKGAMKKKGNSSEILMQSLERRLDNVVFRLGFSKTRAAARQLIGHGHLLINGKKVTIPSYQVRPGEIVTIKPASLVSGQFKNLKDELLAHETPSWLLLKQDELSGKVLEAPRTEELQTIFDPRLIVEFYSR